MTIREKFELNLSAGYVIHKETDQVLFVEEEDKYFNKNLEFFDRLLSKNFLKMFLAEEENDFFSLLSLMSEDAQFLTIPFPVFINWMGIEYSMMDQHFVGHHFVWADHNSWNIDCINYIPMRIIKGKVAFYDMIQRFSNKRQNFILPLDEAEEKFQIEDEFGGFYEEPEIEGLYGEINPNSLKMKLFIIKNGERRKILSIVNEYGEEIY